jgi:hypothetical protein
LATHYYSERAWVINERLVMTPELSYLISYQL